MTFQPKHIAEQLTVPVRSLDYRVYRWGNPDGVPVFLIHGFADTGMSFQFVADAMDEKWCLIAPDLRGFGDTDWDPQGYWFPDYLADLDVLLDIFSPNQTVRLVGHSMGGNIISLYAGIFPDRVSHAASLDQFGLEDSNPDNAPATYARWLKEWREPPVNAEHKDKAYMVKRLKKLAPHLHEERARFLADFWCKPTADGKYVTKIDPGHKRVNPVLYRREEYRSCWRRTTAKVMIALGSESSIIRRYEEGMGEDFKSCFNEVHEVIIENSGHMLHLDQPKKLARALDDFLQK